MDLWLEECWKHTISAVAEQCWNNIKAFSFSPLCSPESSSGARKKIGELQPGQLTLTGERDSPHCISWCSAIKNGVEEKGGGGRDLGPLSAWGLTTCASLIFFSSFLHILSCLYFKQGVFLLFFFLFSPLSRLRRRAVSWQLSGCLPAGQGQPLSMSLILSGDIADSRIDIISRFLSGKGVSIKVFKKIVKRS